MENILLNNLNSDSGKELIQNSLTDFSNVISVLEDHYKMRPFTQQTAQSLTELYLLTHILKPRTIFELGCGTRSSTIALSTAMEGNVYGLDISPINFTILMNKIFPAKKYTPVIDYAMNAIDFKIPDSWDKPIFMLYDAHDEDLPGVKIFPYAEKIWFPKLQGSIITFHDCSITDHLLSFPLGNHFSNKHFSGRYISGFKETIPLTNWLNENKIDFYRPGDDLVKLGFQGDDSSLICVEIL